MIRVIDTASKARTRMPDGEVRTVLSPGEDGTRVEVVVRELDPGKTYRLARSEKTQVAYILEGSDATLTHGTLVGKGGAGMSSTGGRTAPAR